MSATTDAIPMEMLTGTRSAMSAIITSRSVSVSTGSPRQAMRTRASSSPIGARGSSRPATCTASV